MRQARLCVCVFLSVWVLICVCSRVPYVYVSLRLCLHVWVMFLWFCVSPVSMLLCVHGYVSPCPSVCMSVCVCVPLCACLRVCCGVEWGWWWEGTPSRESPYPTSQVGNTCLEGTLPASLKN